MDKNELIIPEHIAFIMDGNGRWAKERRLPRKMGHRAGVEAMRKIISACADTGVKVISVFAFSTENWARPQDEIDELFALVKKFADKELAEYVKSGYRVRFMGDLSALPTATREAVAKISDASAANDGVVVNIGLNYGGRDEIVGAVNAILQSGVKSIDKVSFGDCLDTRGLPDPDVIVRSSGEKRLSNFMLWQAAYSEFIFVDKYWPDFDKETLDEIIAEYSRRDRRYGAVKRVGR